MSAKSGTAGKSAPSGPGEQSDDGLTPLGREILRVVFAIEPGDIMTYGEVAAEAGNPGAARAVGGVLRRHGDGAPWWRVVAANGRLVPGGEALHTSHLKEEGVPVKDGRVVMRRG